MDSPAAVRAFRTYGRNRICYGRARQSRPQRIDNRGAHLADEYRHDRKRSIDRNRRALHFTLRSRDHFLVGFCLAKKIPMAHLVANIDLPRVGLVGERPASSRIFYGIVFAVLWQTKNWRLLIHPAHFTALAIMFGIFAAWAIPFLQSTTTQVALRKWSAQFSGRLSATNFNFSSWIQNVPRALVYFLPWVILFPFVRFARFQDESQRRLARALTWGIVGPFLAVNLVPGALPRYSMPALVPGSWLLAMSYVGNALQWPQRMQLGSERVWTKVVSVFVGLGLVIGGIGYPLAAFVLRNRQQVKKAAAEINALVPAGETLYAVDPDYQPVLFYVKAPLIYATEMTNLPRHTHYFLVETEGEYAATTRQQSAPRRTHRLARITDYRKRGVTLFEVGP